MLHAVRGVFRGGVVELLETPNVAGDTEVIVTFLTTASSVEVDPMKAATTEENVRLLDDFEPIVPAKPVRLSDLVLEDRG